MASNGPMILCDSLVKIYKVQDLEVFALQGLDLVIERGEFMALVGPSGSGKSSLMNILGGLDRPSAGKAIVDGQDLLKLSNFALTRYRRQKVGFVWQQPSRNLIPYLSVEENVELPMIVAGMPYGERKAWTRELLETVNLWDRRHHSLAQLSGGEQQRTAIGVSLANKPVLLLADEPTGEVDTSTAQVIMDTLRLLNEQYGLTILLVTHDVRVSGQVDRVVTIRDGRTSSERVRRLREQSIAEEAVVVAEQPEAWPTPHRRRRASQRWLRRGGLSSNPKTGACALPMPAVGCVACCARKKNSRKVDCEREQRRPGDQERTRYAHLPRGRDRGPCAAWSGLLGAPRRVRRPDGPLGLGQDHPDEHRGRP